ncbi:hypothetical protein PG984_012856 [Apiospora sp. TS-2023a]
MPGLESMAALSLACNILQVIGIGREMVRIAKQVYQDGALDPTLKENAGVLDNLSDRILSITEVTPAATTLAANSKAHDKQLLNLADKCKGAARDLQEEVDFLNGPSSNKKLGEILKIAAKTTWRKRRLQRLDQKLKEAENHFRTGLLTIIYERSVRVDSDLSTLDSDLRAFIKEYRKGHADATDLTRKHVTTETKKSEEAVKSHVTQTTSQTEESMKRNIGVAFEDVIKQGQDTQLDAKRNRLLWSLKFDRMNERRNLVSPLHPNTFTWILLDGSEANGSQITDDGFHSVSDEDSADESESGSEDELSCVLDSWDSFSDWLRSTGTVYWISGMPGLGKTTLMKYLLNQPELRKYLDLWRPGANLLLGDPAAVDQVLRSYDGKSNKDTETDWSGEELQSALHHIRSSYSRPIAIFLDGLDEVLPKDGVLSLLEVVDNLKELYQNNVHHVLYELRSEDTPRSEGKIDVEFMRTDLSRVFLICELLFNYGYLFGAPKISPNSMRAEQLPASTSNYGFKEITVNRRYEFLVEASFCCCFAPYIWDYLLPVAKSRNIDGDTMSQLLVHACSFGRGLGSPLKELETRLEAIEKLLDWGAFPCHETLRRNQPSLLPSNPLITTIETPFRAPVMLIWDIVIRLVVDNGHSQRLLDLLSLCVARGADLQEDLYVTIQVERGHIRYGDIWQPRERFYPVKTSKNSPEKGLDMVLIMGHPASAIITRILNIWRLENLLQMGGLPELQEMGQGHPIAVVDVTGLTHEYNGEILAKTSFHGDMFPLGPGGNLEEGLLSLVRLADSGLLDIASQGKNSSRIAGDILPTATALPSNIQAEAVRALGRMRSTNAPAIERRRKVRMRLGVSTPLEEPEWQNIIRGALMGPVPD